METREPRLALDAINNAFVRFDRVQKSYDGESLVVKDLNLDIPKAVSYTHLRAHETVLDLVCRLLLEKKKK